MAEISQVSEESGGSSRRRAPTTNPCPTTLDSSSLTHTPYYCEENVYFLCKTLCMRGIADHKGTDLFAVFISNEDKKVPLWRQKASERSDGLVIWDYHVICIQTSQEKDNGDARHLVWDIDSSLPCPIPLKEYITEAICPSFPLNRKYGRLFRVVHAPLFLQCFASDRSHMKDPSGNWMAPPPAYKPIVAEDGTENNLNEYIKMRAEDILRDAQALLENAFLDIYFNKFGVVISETMLESFFSQMKPLLSLHEMRDV